MRKGQVKILQKAESQNFPFEYMNLLQDESYPVSFYDFAYKCMLQKFSIQENIAFIEQAWDRYPGVTRVLSVLRCIRKKDADLAVELLSQKYKEVMQEGYTCDIQWLIYNGCQKDDLLKIIVHWKENGLRNWYKNNMLNELCLSALKCEATVETALLYSTRLLSKDKECDCSTDIENKNHSYVNSAILFMKSKIPFKEAERYGFNYKEYGRETQRENLGCLVDIYSSERADYHIEDADKEKLRSIYSMGITAVADIKCYSMHYRKSDTGINIRFNTYAKTKVDIYQSEEKAFSPAGNPASLKLFISNNGGFIQELSVKGRTRHIPVSIKNLSDYYNCNNPFFTEFISNLEKLMIERKIYLFKDIVKYIKDGLFLPPVTLNEVMQCHNMQELMGRYPSLLNYNKYNANLLYLTHKVSRYVREDDVNKILQYSDEGILKRAGITNHSSFTRYKLSIREFFYQYYMDKFSDEECIKYCKGLCDDISLRDAREEVEMIISDYIDICLKSKEKINLKFNSIKKISDEHLRLSEREMMRDYNRNSSRITIPNNSNFLKLRKMLPEEFEWIKTRSRLNKESMEQHHCVWQYGEKISKDNCAIYSFIYEPENRRYTIEFIAKNGKYHIRQMQCAYDRGYSDNAWTYVESFITEEKIS